jgi:hypothetical protein
MDAIAAVLILLFFAVTSFNSSASTDWNQYQNSISANDLSYTLKQTGLAQDFVESGDTGSLKTAVDTVSIRSLDVAGEITGVPPNLDIGYYALPSKISSASVSRIESSDPCYSEVQNELSPLSSTPILRTNDGGVQAQNDGITIYIGDYKDGQGVASQLNYDALWIDKGTQCDFEQIHDPRKVDEMFEWGTGNYYEFRSTEVNVSSWEGDLQLAEANQMKRFQTTMEQDVNKVNNHVKLNSFTFADDLENLDLLIFPQRDSILRIQNQGYQNRVKQAAKEKPVLFLAQLDETTVNDGIIETLGFEWEGLTYRSQTGANCPVNGDTIDNCGPLEISFSDTENSNNLHQMALGQDTDLSSVSLYPQGSLAVKNKGTISFEKTMYLENYGYNEISEDRVNKGLSDTTVSGRPSTSCNDVTEGTFSFPNASGSLQGLNVVNTQLGNSESYCNQNIRALYIDRDGDGDYDEDNEGPFQDGNRITVRGLRYTVEIYSDAESGCDNNDCAGFILQENSQVSVFNYNSENNVGRAGYESTYTSTDRKMLAGFIYMMAGSTDIESDSQGDILTNLYGSTDQEAYRMNLRWGN